ncbi:MAG: zinc metallopeptidase [Lachnospiraceae bacterium]
MMDMLFHVAYYSHYGYYFDWTYLLVIIGAVLSMAASWKVQSTFKKYSGYRSASGMTGAMAAERILHGAGIYDVSVQHISGNLTDHYDPSSKVLRLSDSVYGSTSVAAVGVAAHECGHAIQHSQQYAPLTIRGSLVPVANFGSAISWPLILVGVILGWNEVLIQIGILLFSAAVLFQLVTLPVEINASKRALRELEQDGILGSQELSMTRKVLGAAALTYVAAAAASILQLLRLIMLFGGRRRD